MVWIMAAVIGTFVLWKVSAFFADHPPKKIELPPISLPVVEWRAPEIPELTPEQQYHQTLARIERSPFDEDEKKAARDEARLILLGRIRDDMG